VAYTNLRVRLAVIRPHVAAGPSKFWPATPPVFHRPGVGFSGSPCLFLTGLTVVLLTKLRLLDSILGFVFALFFSGHPISRWWGCGGRPSVFLCPPLELLSFGTPFSATTAQRLVLCGRQSSLPAYLTAAEFYRFSLPCASFPPGWPFLSCFRAFHQMVSFLFYTPPILLVFPLFVERVGSSHFPWRSSHGGGRHF